MFAALPPAPPAAIAPAAAEASRHVVRRGETVSSIARRYGVSWNALRRANRIGPGDVIRVGQRLVIPGAATSASTTRSASPAPSDVPTTSGTRAQVRQALEDAARQYGVDVDLALAIGWQESRWRQNVVSHVGARGVMQCMPSTGRWMSTKAGRDLDLADLEDNATCGVLLLRTLQRQTGDDDAAIAAYYQGLGSIRAHGRYPSTERYVASVKEHRARLAAGHPLLG